MGKKSTESVPEFQETNRASDSLISGSAGVTELDLYQHLMQKILKQIKPPPATRLFSLGSNWREENRDKYLREVSQCFNLICQCLLVILKVKCYVLCTFPFYHTILDIRAASSG